MYIPIYVFTTGHLAFFKNVIDIRVCFIFTDYDKNKKKKKRYIYIYIYIYIYNK